ncbi:MAG: SDR family oxidoreductase, partial [Comamonadaceae bacterium]
AALAPVLQSLQTIDVLVHIAGGFEMGEAVDELGRDTWDRMMQLNAWSFVAVARSLVPAMVATKSGRIVAVTAKAAARGGASMSAYAASKSALARLVESMADELAPQGVRVNSVAPSILDTPANRQAMPAADPSGWVSTAQAAAVIAFLASPAADVLRGQHLVLEV